MPDHRVIRSLEPLSHAVARKVDEIAELLSGEEDEAWMTALAMMATRVFICVDDPTDRMRMWEWFRNMMEDVIKSGAIETLFERDVQ